MDREGGGGVGAEGDVDGVGVHRAADGGLLAPNLLGAVVGRDGADLLLRDLGLLHAGLRLLPPHFSGPLLRGLLPGPVRYQASRPLEGPWVRRRAVPPAQEKPSSGDA